MDSQRKTKTAEFTPLETECTATCRGNERPRELANAGSRAPHDLLTGFTIFEVVIAVAIIAMTFFGMTAAFQGSLQLARQNLRTTQASFLLEEGVEAVKVIRNDNWSNITALTPGTTYYFNWNGTTWEETNTNQFIDGLFERSFVLEEVARDAEDDIAASGTTDSGTRKVTVTVSWWSGSATTSREIQTYITDVRG